MKFILFLVLLPVITLTSAVFVYKFQGKKDLLHLDLVQFFYTFILAPLLFVWFKILIFSLMQSGGITHPEVFFIADTLFSLIMLYIYAFVVMHSLTTTFRLKSVDPLYNLFSHSEYIHLWLSHLVMGVGGLTLLSILALVNLFMPGPFQLTRSIFWFSLLISFFLGILGFIMIMIADPKQQVRVNYMRLMKLVMGGNFLILTFSYFLLNPGFKASYIVYWLVLSFFVGMVAIGLFSYKSSKARSKLDLILGRLVHSDWGNNISVLKKK